MSFIINVKGCESYDAWLASAGCSEDTFRTMSGIIVTGGSASLDPNSSKTLLQQIIEMQYAPAPKRGYYIPFEEITAVSGGDVRTTARTDGFPTSIEENVPVIDAALATNYKSIYIHKQLRKFNRANIKFYAITDSGLVLGETDSTGLLKPTNGIVHKGLMLPAASSGNGTTADIKLYYENTEALGDDIAFAALPKGTNLGKYLQQIAEIKMVADTATALKAKLKFYLARSNEDITKLVGAAIAAGGVIKAYAVGATTETAITLAYAAGEVTATFTGAFTGSLVLDEPEDLLAANVGTLATGTYAAEPISVTVTAA